MPVVQADGEAVGRPVADLSGTYVPVSTTINGKPLSAAVNSTADDVEAIPASQKGQANGVAELDSSGKVPAAQLPSHVDDVVEYDSQRAFPETGEDGKIYIAKDTNLTYRWSGAASTWRSQCNPGRARRRARHTDVPWKAAYDHSHITKGNPHGTTAADVARPLSSHDNRIRHPAGTPRAAETSPLALTAQ